MNSVATERKQSRAQQEVDLATLIFRTLPKLGRLAHTALQGGAASAPVASLVRARVLMQLLGGPLRTGDLATRCAMSAPATTELIDALESDGRVKRVDDRADRRVVLVELTDRGRAEVKRSKARIDDALAAALAPLTPAERSRLYSAFTDLESALARAFAERESHA